MRSENVPRDIVRFAKACTSNLLARFLAPLYVRVTRQTGRGSDEADAHEIADYFIRSFNDYGARLGLAEGDFVASLRGKRVLEYGPGDILGVALLFHAHGAAQVHCVDRFPLEKVSTRNVEVYQALLERLPPAARERAARAFVIASDPTSGFKPECVEYRVTADGLARQDAAYDLIVSRAVLEHVNSLEGTLRDIERCLAPGGLSVHNVDLRSHNLDRDHPFDFLTWPDPVYRLMYSHKGFPNRWRPNAYRDILKNTSLDVVMMEPTGRLPSTDVERIRDKLATPLRGASADELSWLGFWMVLRREGAV